MRQFVGVFARRSLITATASMCALGCSADNELVPRPDAQARVYFAAGDTQTVLNVSQWPSPSGRYVAHSDSTDWAEERITVTDTQTGRVIPIVTIRESDPGSGRSHHVAWAADGTALLITGSGALDGAQPTPLCLVYRIAAADLLSAAPCTPAPRAGS